MIDPLLIHLKTLNQLKQNQIHSPRNAPNQIRDVHNKNNNKTDAKKESDLREFSPLRFVVGGGRTRRGGMRGRPIPTPAAIPIPSSD